MAGSLTNSVLLEDSGVYLRSGVYKGLGTLPFIRDPTFNRSFTVCVVSC